MDQSVKKAEGIASQKPPRWKNKPPQGRILGALGAAAATILAGLVASRFPQGNLLAVALMAAGGSALACIAWLLFFDTRKDFPKWFPENRRWLLVAVIVGISLVVLGGGVLATDFNDPQPQAAALVAGGVAGLLVVVGWTAGPAPATAGTPATPEWLWRRGRWVVWLLLVVLAVGLFAARVSEAQGWFSGPVVAGLNALAALAALAGLVFALRAHSAEWPKNKEDVDYAKVFLGVFCGYALVGVVLSGAVGDLVDPSDDTVSGFSTQDFALDPLLLRVQTNTTISLSPISPRVSYIPVSVELLIPGRPGLNHTGSAVLSVRSTQSGVGLSGLGDGRIEPDAGAIWFNLSYDSRFAEKSATFKVSMAITYNLTYNLTSVANETFDDVYIFELEFQVRASDFTSGWYLLFLFVGILTSLWWRLLNEYLDPLKEPLDKLGTNNRRITYLVFLPIASFLIAVAIFRQFQKDITLTSDPLVNVVAGFTYGFFWESVTNKFGKTVFAGTDFSTPPPQPGPAGQGGGGGQSTNQLGGGPAAPLPGPQPPGAPTPQPLPAPVQQAPPAPAPQPASAPLQQPPAAPLPSPAAAPAEKK